MNISNIAKASKILLAIVAFYIIFFPNSAHSDELTLMDNDYKEIPLVNGKKLPLVDDLKSCKQLQDIINVTNKTSSDGHINSFFGFEKATLSEDMSLIRGRSLLRKKVCKNVYMNIESGLGTKVCAVNVSLMSYSRTEVARRLLNDPTIKRNLSRNYPIYKDKMMPHINIVYSNSYYDNFSNDYDTCRWKK
ncbi:hypothetical protein [Chamaesiphon polymorphus]|uniref:Uncharacterized protein n=1 Tax=Chamaesiphon polymorphus CCALA 037 TaxID=2107692 RepID=A0A2T1FG89_9CYAN|nr:hypothetical protein [Chamaesiphon polymorphus]PSB43990.1 hypothetical protein C7B77_25885 [Chamaesiphon polymorphus CCALA 037]